MKSNSCVNNCVLTGIYFEQIKFRVIEDALTSKPDQ